MTPRKKKIPNIKCKWCQGECDPSHNGKKDDCTCPRAMPLKDYKVQTDTGYRWTNPGERKKR